MKPLMMWMKGYWSSFYFKMGSSATTLPSIICKGSAATSTRYLEEVCFHGMITYKCTLADCSATLWSIWYRHLTISTCRRISICKRWIFVTNNLSLWYHTNLDWVEPKRSGMMSYSNIGTTTTIIRNINYCNPATWMIPVKLVNSGMKSSS